VRSAFRKGLWLGEHDDASEEELMAIYRSLIDVMDRQYPQCFGKMYDKIRPKVERYYRERNKQTKRKGQDVTKLICCHVNSSNQP